MLQHGRTRHRGSHAVRPHKTTPGMRSRPEAAGPGGDARSLWVMCAVKSDGRPAGPSSAAHCWCPRGLLGDVRYTSIQRVLKLLSQEDNQHDVLHSKANTKLSSRKPSGRGTARYFPASVKALPTCSSWRKALRSPVQRHHSAVFLLNNEKERNWI